MRKFWFEKNQFYVMIMESALEKGQYIIKMDFRAWLTNDLAGLYKSTYKRKNGKEVYVTYINNTFIRLLDYLQSYFLSYVRKGVQCVGNKQNKDNTYKTKSTSTPSRLFRLFGINAGVTLGENRDCKLSKHSASGSYQVYWERLGDMLAFLLESLSVKFGPFHVEHSFVAPNPNPN